MPVEQVAGLEILAEHIEARVPAKALEFARMDAAVSAGGHGAVFEAVSGDVTPAERRHNGVDRDDVGDRAPG